MVQVQTLRYTPAGIPALNIVLEHASEVVEMDTPRQVNVQLKAVVFGVQAEVLARSSLDASYHFHGFLSNVRNGKGLLFHIQDFSKT